MDISIIVPLFNEDESLPHLAEWIDRVMEEHHFDYEVITPDAEQFNALTLAYLKAGVPNIAVPQDNVLFAFLYKKMKE